MSEPPQKRFRYATYTEKLSSISVDVGKTKGLTWEKEDFGEEAQSKTPFTVELARLSLQDLTLPYQELSGKLEALTLTLPMTLHNLKEITDAFFAFFASLKDGVDHSNSGLDSTLFLLQALFETCLGETTQYVPETIQQLVRIGALRLLEPKLVERTYSTMSLCLRTISASLLKLENKTILRATWAQVRPYLRPQDNKPYVRKCIADAWAGVLRKARGDALQRLMSVLLEEETSGMEAVWTNSMKGTSNHLHSRAIPIFTVLLDEIIQTPKAEEVKMLRNVVTALVHHCTSSQISPLVEVVIDRVILPDSASASSSTSKPAIDFDKQTAVLDVLNTFLFTRRGKRFPASQLKPAMLKLQRLVPHMETFKHEGSDLTVEQRSTLSSWRQNIVACVVGTLNAGHLAEWLSPGVALIDVLWQSLSTPEAFAFVNMCISFKWSGVEQFLLAHISRTALTSLTTDLLPTLILLNTLASAGYLTGGLSNVQGGRWRKALVITIAKLIQQLGESELLQIEDRRVLGQALSLIPYFSGESDQFGDDLVVILDAMIRKPKGDVRIDWDTNGPLNDTHIVGQLLTSISRLSLSASDSFKKRIRDVLSDSSRVNKLIENWHWSREVMERTAFLVETWGGSLKEANIELLIGNISSADSSLRLSTLSILRAHAVGSSDTAAVAIWSFCREIEVSEMSLKNVRERTAQITRLGRHLETVSEAVEDDRPMVCNFAIEYLVTQLKVNFRPIWAETVTVLSSLSSKFSVIIWDTVWHELEKTIAADKTTMPDLDVVYPLWTAEKIDNDFEEVLEADEDIEFRCTGLLKCRGAVSRAWKQNHDPTTLDVAEIQSQISKDRLDVLSYESQLLATLTAIPSLAEKHSRDIVPVVLAVCGSSSETTVALQHLSTRQLQQRSINFLELLAKFVNPKATYRSTELHALYLDLLSKGEPKVQAVALRCLLTFKSPTILPYSERLRNLLDDSKFRDELAHLNLGIDSEVIEPQHRKDIIPVIIRLLFGIMTSRRGRSSTSQGQGPRKQAVLTALSGCLPDELKTLVDLMLEPFGGFDSDFLVPPGDASIIAAGRQQLGFLTLLQDLIRYLAPQTVSHWPRLVTATITLIDHAQKAIDHEKDSIVIDVEDDEDEVNIDGVETDKGSAPMRTIRSAGLKRLVQFLRSPSAEFDFSPFLEAIFSSVISPRLAKLELENTQAPSGTLDLIAALAASPDTAQSLVAYDTRTLPKTFACLTAIKVKPAVIGRVFDVVDSLLTEEGSETVQTVLLPCVRGLIDHIIGLVQSLKQAANEDIMRRLLSILSRLSAVVTDGQQAQQLAALLGPMLRQPSRQVSEKAKVNILTILQRLYCISPDFADKNTSFFNQSYDLISNLFQTLHLPGSRRALVTTLQTFSTSDPTLVPVVSTVSDLNAYLARRMEEPDFDKRLSAFAQLNDSPISELPQTPREWLPIIRSSLFFIQEPEELSIRTNASSTLQRFISLVANATSGPFVDSIQFVILPALRRILLSKLELVRNEVLLVFSHAVKTCTGIQVLEEMRPLLGEDDETNVFVNVSHIQVHRRSRAIRRLRDVCAQGGIRETTLSTIFLPVLEHIITGATEVTDHHLVNEAILSIGSLASNLPWSRYNAQIMRYLRLGTPKSPQQKFYIRAVSAVIDHFHFDLQDTPDQKVDNGTAEELDDDASDGDETPVVPLPTQLITEAVLTRLLPALSNFVSQKSETDENVRIPLALGVVKVASALPEEVSSNEVLRIITTVSQILRSKDQDTRDIARDTIGKIAVFLGPEWLVRILRELRTALQRGPQKHVLAVTTHSILVHATTEASEKFGNLDEAIEDAAEISAEVIWGESGRDVANEGFKTKMREVRGATSRGNDTFQLLSRIVSPSKIGAVLSPVREVMHVSQAIKTMQQVDEVLRRIALGLNANNRIGPEDLLSLCFSLINGNSQYLQAKRKAPKASKPIDRFQVQMKRVVKEDEDVYPQNAYKFVMFGLELFVTAFRRGKFDFDDVNILSRLGPLVNAIGNTLYSPNSLILILGLKATAAIAKCPVPQVDQALPAFISNIFKIIKNAGGTAESEVSQTALKTLAVLIRDCKAVEVSETQLRYLIEVVSPDLEDHDRQSAIFTVLRAVVARRFVIPEIYDLMERVSSIMVTSQSSHVQELCRGVLMQFLLDYPQGQGRLKAQMTFLARNLDYVFESGRSSVMEVLAAVFGKFSQDLITQFADLFFVALVAVIANDDSEKCRNMAGALLQQLYGNLEDGDQERTLQVLGTWVEARNENPALARASLAVYGLLCDSGEAVDRVFTGLPKVIVPVIRDSAAQLARAEASDDVITLDHGLPHQALLVTAKSIKLSPVIIDTIPWADVVAHLLFPHEWVRFGAARALSVLFAMRPPSPSDDGDALSLLGRDLILDIMRKSCVLLGGSKTAEGDNIVVDTKLADQLVKLLWNITKYWTVLDSAVDEPESNTGDEPGEDEEEPSNVRPLAWLMSRMSFLARHLIINRPSSNSVLPGQRLLWTGPVMSILRFFAGVFDQLRVRQAKLFLVHILSPIYRVLDENGDLTGLDDAGGIDELRQLATEVRDLVQNKVGTTLFSRTWEGLRKKVGEKRQDRREARTRLAVADPKAWADRKEKRGIMKKDSKKRKVHAYMDQKRSRPNKKRSV